jgi:hypothetical protein
MTKARIWVSRVFTVIIALALTATAVMKLARVPKMVDGLTHAGIPAGAVTPIALLELTCLVLYLLPRTMVLGAVLLTGYFGGAIVVHIVGGESVLPVIMIGLWVWAGIYFRVPSLQELLPLRKDTRAGRAAGETIARIPRPDFH